MEALSWRWLHYFYTFLPGSPSRIVQQNRGVTGVVSLLVVGTCLSLLAASSVAARASAAVKSEYYENPVADAPAPDPGVLYFSGSYYAATTGNFGNNAFPLRKSADLVQWAQVSWVFPDWKARRNPQWAFQDFWAPELHIVDGRFMVYFTARNSEGILCIGAAFGESATGPFTDIGEPLVYNKSEGVIDATYFNDSGAPFVIWKVDGNAHGNPTPILAAMLSKDGTEVIGSPVELITNDKPWEGALVEAPWVVKYQDVYYLFYSAGGGYLDKTYSVWVARSEKLLGPYEKNDLAVLHTASPESNRSWEGPGHCSVLPVHGSTHDGYAIVYHAWWHGEVGPPFYRVMLTDTLTWRRSNGGVWPEVNNGTNVPSEGQVPVPS